MKHEETLDNLWIVFASGARGRVFHRRALQSSRFTPT
jgi:hypothetical protein